VHSKFGGKPTSWLRCLCSHENYKFRVSQLNNALKLVFVKLFCNNTLSCVLRWLSWNRYDLNCHYLLGM
jgi:hypothetical protein